MLRRSNIFLGAFAGIILAGIVILFLQPGTLWSAINSFMPRLLGDKLQCEEIHWCGFLKMCNYNCKTLNETEYIKQFIIDLPKGQSIISNWTLNSIPQIKGHQNAKRFPRIPFVIRSVILRNGNVKPISPYVHQIDYLSMERNTWGFGGEQDWHITGRVHNGQISLDGRAGDKTDLTLQVKDFLITEDLPDLTSQGCSKINGVQFNLDKLQLTSNKFRQEPFVLDTHVGYLDILTNHEVPKCYPKAINLQHLQINLDTDFLLKGVHALDLRFKTSNNKWITINDTETPHKYKLNSLPADYLIGLLPDVLAPYHIDILKLGGNISGEFNELTNKGFIEFIDPKPYLRVHDHNIQINNDFDFHGLLEINLNKPHTNEYAHFDIDFNRFNLALLKPLITKSVLDINSGELGGNIQYNIIDKDIHANWKVNNLSLVENTSAFTVNNGTGTISLDNQYLAIDITGQNPVNSKQKLYLNSKFDLGETYKTATGYMHFHSDHMGLNTIKLNELDLSGDLHNINCRLNYENGQYTGYISNFDLFNNKIKVPNTDTIIAKSGSVYLKDNNIKTKNLNLVYGLGSKLKSRSTNININPDKTVNIKDLHLAGNISTQDLHRLATYNNNNLNTKSSTGSLHIATNIKNNKIHSFNIYPQDLNINYNNHDVKKIEGSVYLHKDNLVIDKFKFKLDDNSYFVLDSKIKFRDLNIHKISKDINKYIDTFSAKLTGKINLKKAIELANNKIPQLNLRIGNYDTVIPIAVEFSPSKKIKNLKNSKQMDFSIKSNLESLQDYQANNKDINLVGYELPAFLNAEGSIDLSSQDFAFDIRDFECVLNGLNLAGRAQGKLDDFSVELFTDPLIDLNRLFQDIQGQTILGSLHGKATASNVNMLEPLSLWDNLELDMSTLPSQSVQVGDVQLDNLKLNYLTQNGVGFSIFTVEQGRYRNLPFNDVNASIRLADNKFYIDGLSLATADGEFNLSGNFKLKDHTGYFEGNAQDLSVGKVARGLANIRGFSGRGDFYFGINGRLLTLFDLQHRKESPVSASGSFHLKNGNVSKIMDIESKLNLANLVFGGPYALNLNTLLEILSPQNDGYYKYLDGELLLEDNNITLNVIRYRGLNDLKLNMSGTLDREQNNADITVIGSIPKIPKRVTSGAQLNHTLNALTEWSLPNILGRLNILDKRPRVYTFDLRGDPSNSAQMNNSASNTFEWLDSSLSNDLPIPELKDK